MAPPQASRVNIEFTLALNNRTGKYFFCQDLINAASDQVGSILYWRLPLKRLPTGLFARILGRLAAEEIKCRVAVPLLHRWLPLIRRKRPVVFMDPREVIFHALTSTDCVICHDMGPITHPDLYHDKVKPIYELAFAKICATKPSMIFVSKSSMTAFIALYGDDFPAMTVISPPLRTGIIDGPDEPVPGVQPTYLLTVGSIGARKNQARAIEAFKLADLAARGYGYVLCGGPEPGFEAVAALADATRGVVRLGYVSDAQLRWLYRNAVGFVLPSLLEGFGLPAAEAIAYGLVPLVSRGGALHEVAGDGAILVEPTSIDDIAAGMRQLTSIRLEQHERLLSRLNASVARFSKTSCHDLWRHVLYDIRRSSIAINSKLI